MLLAAFCFSVMFRISVVFHNPYPPSSDIGFHGSIINLILDQKTLPTWNPYHMGGEPLVTPPGFHFFVSMLILLTGMPITLAQPLTATFFSATMVFPVYLIAKKIWKNQNTGLLAAFFTAISALSIEMLTWGGYPNIVSLFLMSVIFYLFLKDADTPDLKHLMPATSLFASLVLTHTFSLAVFVPIMALYVVLLLVGKLLKIKEIQLVNRLRFFAVSATLGLVTISPWLLRVFPFYVTASAEGALTGGLDNKNLILANCKIDPIILALAVLIIPALILFKQSRKSYFDQSSLLLLAWFLVPILMTQSYLFGIYTHYSRFLYFVDFPLIIITYTIWLFSCKITKSATNKFSKTKGNKLKNSLHVILFTIIVFFFIFSSSWSMVPQEGLKEANTYSTIQQPEATALEWLQKNIPQESVIAADHLYGWWLSGIGKRPTLSAAELQFLLYSHEIQAAKNAQLLLDTNYYVNNGLIQIKDDGSYISRHNPEVSIQTCSGEPFSLFEFNQTQLVHNQTSVHFSNMKITENTIHQFDNFTVRLNQSYENERFIIKKTLQVQPSVRFIEIGYEIKTKTAQTTDFEVKLSVNTQANHNLTLINPSQEKQIMAYDSSHNVAGQIIFSEPYPKIDLIHKNGEISYNSQNQSLTIKMLVGVFETEKISFPEEGTDLFEKNSDNPLAKFLSSNEVTFWEYTNMIEEFNVTHVVCRDQTVTMKFAKDPHFQQVFHCGNVTIFQIKR